MVPLILAAVNSEIMDSVVILSDRIANRILEYREDKIAGNTTPFFFCAYVLDALCFNSEFPFLGWKWTAKDPTPIHIYHKLLWKVHFKDHVYIICHGFLIPVFQTIFNHFPPRFSDKAKADLSSIGDWFGEEKFTYVRIFGSIVELHVLPLFVPDKLLAQEISYQLTVEGMSRSLSNSKKRMWPSFPFNCVHFTLNDFKHVEKEVAKINGFKLETIPGRQYDPQKIAFNVTSSVSIA